MQFKMLPSAVIEYLGDNKVSIKNEVNGTQVKSLLGTADYLAWKDSDEETQRKAVVREMVSLARLLALPVNRLLPAGSTPEIYRVNLIVPADWWGNRTLQWLLSYAANKNHRDHETGTHIHLDGMVEYLPFDTSTLIFLTRPKEEVASVEAHPVDDKIAFLKKIADYIGDQDIDHVIITTKAGAQIRVDP